MRDDRLDLLSCNTLRGTIHIVVYVNGTSGTWYHWVLQWSSWRQYPYSLYNLGRVIHHKMGRAG